MLAVAMVGQALFGEKGAILGGFLGLALGFGCARTYSIKHQKNWQPLFLRRCDHVNYNQSNIIVSTQK
jgi:positive regulator of sigma E activity